VLEADQPIVDDIAAYFASALPPLQPFRGLEAGREMLPTC